MVSMVTQGRVHVYRLRVCYGRYGDVFCKDTFMGGVSSVSVTSSGQRSLHAALSCLFCFKLNFMEF